MLPDAVVAAAGELDSVRNVTSTDDEPSLPQLAPIRTRVAASA